MIGLMEGSSWLIACENTPGSAYPMEPIWSFHIYKMSFVMRKPFFCIFENKNATQISFAVTAKLISAFVFATRLEQSLNYLYTKFQASSYLLGPYSPVCVGPSRKPRRPVFSQRGSNILSSTRIVFAQLLYFRMVWFR